MSLFQLLSIRPCLLLTSVLTAVILYYIIRGLSLPPLDQGCAHIIVLDMGQLSSVLEEMLKSV